MEKAMDEHTRDSTGGPETDAKLSTLLRQWKPMEPRTGFDEGVWRRIRSESADEPHRLPVFESLREWLIPNRGWITTAAAAAGVVLGVGVAASTPDLQAHNHDQPLLHSETLAGSYLSIAGGNAR
jgi:hypothetical protein